MEMLNTVQQLEPGPTSLPLTPLPPITAHMDPHKRHGLLNDNFTTSQQIWIVIVLCDINDFYI